MCLNTHAARPLPFPIHLNAKHPRLLRRGLARSLLLILVSGTLAVGRAASPSDLDTTFAAGVGADSTVNQIVPLADGKVLISGYFTNYDGVVRSRIARLNPDGSLDSTFDAEAGAGGGVNALAWQSDGRLLVAGEFAQFADQPWVRIGRLLEDGSFDSTFQPGAGLTSTNGFSTAMAMAVQSDDKVVVGGYFTQADNRSQAYVARLHRDGAFDDTFRPIFLQHSSYLVTGLAIQTDGRILAGGQFDYVNGLARRGLVRINPDGSLDESFDAAIGAPAVIFKIVVLPDQKILIAGFIIDVQQQYRQGIARLNSDGSLDQAFDPGAGGDNSVTALALQADGRIVIGGRFTNWDGRVRNRLARLEPNGSLDLTFDPGAGVEGSSSPAVLSLGIQADGRILMGGTFRGYAGVARGRVARLVGSWVTPEPKPSQLGISAPGADGKVTVSVVGEVGGHYVIEVANALGAWEVWQDFVATAVQTDFSDATTSGNGARFYRTQSL